MRVDVALTRLPPRVVVSRNPFDSEDEPLWHCEIWPSANDGGESIDLMADSPEDFHALALAILAAVHEARGS
jgi:hypothetical protein